VNGAVRAIDKRTTFAPKPLDIRVQTNGFGKASPADITAVLQSAALEIWKHCSHTQLDGIDVYYRADHPQTDFKRTPSGRIGIGLSARDTHWAQYAFQFAHEFCHALANYSNDPQRSVRYPRHANLWLEESLCETASLFALRAMSRSWRTAPPYPAWRSYAPWFNDYVEHRLALPEHRFWFGSTRIRPPCARTPTCATETRSSRSSSCPFLKQNHAVGERSRFSIADPLMRRNRWRSVLSSGAPNVRRTFVHLLPDSQEFSR